jgi:thymidylate synthase
MSYDKIYQAGIFDILGNGDDVPTRAMLESTGKKIGARSLLGYGMDFRIYNPHSPDHGKLPLLTCKQVNWRPMIRELLWMISGSTNVKDLHKDNVHIWDQWAGKDGELGPVYGAAWRRYEGVGGTFDQLGRAIEGIRCVVKDPTESVGRRLIVNAWDPTRISEMKLPTCHCFFQFFVRGSLLHLSLYQRSADAFLGVPFNIASYATLLMMVAQITGLKPGTFFHRFGDLHLYENHIDQALELINRGTRPPPSLILDPACKEIDDFKFESFELVGYNHMGPMKGEVAV